MNLTSIKTIKELLSKHNVRPSKGLGQNFLVNPRVLAKIIETAHLSKDDIVLEVGPGIGTLTKELAKKTERVIAVEKDKKMVEILKETLENFKSVNIITADILKVNFQFSIFNFQLNSNFQLSKKYKVVANLPYYITSPLIRKFVEAEKQPELMVLMVQKEVAQRICSKSPNMNLLAVSVQFYAIPKIISYVKKENFWPKPKVDSAIIKIVPQQQYPTFLTSGKLSIAENNKKSYADNFFKIVKAGFKQPRKQLANNLSKTLKKDRSQINKWLISNNIKPEQRAQTLSIADWKNLANSYHLI